MSNLFHHVPSIFEDGFFGTKTVIHLQWYLLCQDYCKLKIDGHVGLKTIKALQIYLNHQQQDSDNINTNINSNEKLLINGDFETRTVKALQNLLNKYFVYRNDPVVCGVEIDGKFGERTVLALQRYLNQKLEELHKQDALKYPIIGADGIFLRETKTALHLFLFCQGYCVSEMGNTLYPIINREFQKYLNDKLDRKYSVAMNGRFDESTVCSLRVLLSGDSKSNNSNSNSKIKQEAKTDGHADLELQHHDDVDSDEDNNDNDDDHEDVPQALRYGNFAITTKTTKAFQQYMNKVFAKLNSHNNINISSNDNNHDSQNEKKNKYNIMYMHNNYKHEDERKMDDGAPSTQTPKQTQIQMIQPSELELQQDDEKARSSAETATTTYTHYNVNNMERKPYISDTSHDHATYPFATSNPNVSDINTYQSGSEMEKRKKSISIDVSSINTGDTTLV